LDGNIIVNVGDLDLGVILSGRCRGRGRGKARQGKNGEESARQDETGPGLGLGLGLVGVSLGQDGIRDQDRGSIWKEIEEEIADVPCFGTC
jgi:hypothetical protein